MRALFQERFAKLTENSTAGLPWESNGICSRVSRMLASGCSKRRPAGHGGDGPGGAAERREIGAGDGQILEPEAFPGGQNFLYGLCLMGQRGGDSAPGLPFGGQEPLPAQRSPGYGIRPRPWRPGPDAWAAAVPPDPGWDRPGRGPPSGQRPWRAGPPGRSGPGTRSGRRRSAGPARPSPPRSSGRGDSRVFSSSSRTRSAERARPVRRSGRWPPAFRPRR